MLRPLALATLAVFSLVASAGEKAVELFDGKSLTAGTVIRLTGGSRMACIVGEVTPNTLLKRNSFLIWRGGTVDHFELVVESRVSAKGNSGINYRSIETPGDFMGIG